MYRIFLVAWMLVFAFMSQGCAVGLKKAGESSSAVSQEERATSIYQVAKNCWSDRASVLKHGTVVSSLVTLEGIAIEARWAAPLELSEQAPFIRIYVKSVEGGSMAEVFEKPHGYMGKDKYRRDADRWIAGNYSCT